MCDNLCIERFYENHLKSQTQTNGIRKRENSISSIPSLTEPKQPTKVYIDSLYNENKQF